MSYSQVSLNKVRNFLKQELSDRSMIHTGIFGMRESGFKEDKLKAKKIEYLYDDQRHDRIEEPNMRLLLEED